MPDSESKQDAPSAEESGVTQTPSSAETDEGWDALVGDSEEITAPVTPVTPPPVAARPPAPLFTPSTPGSLKAPPVPGIPAAPPVPGIKPGPLFTPPKPKAEDAATSSDEAEEVDVDEDDADEEPSEQTDRAPARLPTPGVWGKQAPHDAVIDFVRREDAADFFTRANASASEDSGAHAPREIRAQDTQALIASMAEEIEEEAEAQKAAEEAERARKAKEAALLEQPTIIYDRSKADDESESKLGWMAIAVAALAGVVLIGWSIVGSGDEATEATDDQPAAAVAAAERPEPAQPSEPAAVPEPVPEPVPAPTEEDGAETGGEDLAAETGDEVVEELIEDPPEQTAPAAEGAAANDGSKKTRGPSKKKSKSTSASSPASSQGPKAATKPKPPAGGDKSAAELLSAAKKANASGQGSKAYSLASQSYQKKASSDAGEVMVLAACKMKNTGKARAAMGKVKLLKRRNLKQRCKSMGVNL